MQNHFWEGKHVLENWNEVMAWNRIKWIPNPWAPSFTRPQYFQVGFENESKVWKRVKSRWKRKQKRNSPHMIDPMCTESVTLAWNCSYVENLSLIKPSFKQLSKWNFVLIHSLLCSLLEMQLQMFCWVFDHS